MKILVLGCNGMAGHMISLVLKEDGHEVICSMIFNFIVGI